jgi:hypothetical protein
MNSLLPIKQEPTGAPGSGQLSTSRTRSVHAIVLTESLAETGADGVEGLTKHVEWHAGLYGNMPDTRTVEVHFDAALMRVRRDANYFVLWKYRPTKGIL